MGNSSGRTRIRYQTQAGENDVNPKRVINIITPVSEKHEKEFPENLEKIKANLLGALSPVFWEYIQWFVIYDTPHTRFGAEVLRDNFTMRWRNHWSGKFGNEQRNVALRNITTGWVYFLDYDNLLGPGIPRLIEKDAVGPAGFIFPLQQFIKQQDGTVKEKPYIIPDPEQILVDKVDAAQFLCRKEFFLDAIFRADVYNADGWFIQRIYASKKDVFKVMTPEDGVWANWNALRPSTKEMPIIK